MKTDAGDVEVYELDMSMGFATGSLVSTVRSMAQWTQALLKGELLGENAMKELLDFSVNAGDVGYYGGGIEKYNAGPEDYIVGKVANILGYTSIMTHDMNEDISLVVFINYDNEMGIGLVVNMAMIGLGVVK